MYSMSETPTSIKLAPTDTKLLLKLRKAGEKQFPGFRVNNSLIFKLGLMALAEKWEVK